jgi:nucleotide-binding universal stress UspA family protein
MQKILVGTDFGESANATVAVAARLAAATGAELHVLHAIANPILLSPTAMAIDMPVGVDNHELEAAVNEQLETTMAKIVEINGDITITLHRGVGSAADSLCRLAEQIGADVIVVGNRNMKGKARLLGSVASKVAHHAPCHVLIAHST